MTNHPAAALPSPRPICNTPMRTTATTVEPPSPPATAVKPDPQERLDSLLTGHYLSALVYLFGCFTLTPCVLGSDSPADVAVAAVMFCYSMAVSILLLRYWHKKQNNELAAGSGCRIMVWLSLVTGVMFISLVITALLLRPDWRDIALIVAVFLWAIAFLLGFVREEELREMRNKAKSDQEKTSDHV